MQISRLEKTEQRITTHFIKLPAKLFAAIHKANDDLDWVPITHALVSFEVGRPFPSVRHVVGGTEVQFADQIDGFIDVVNAEDMDRLGGIWSPEKCDCNRCCRMRFVEAESSTDHAKAHGGSWRDQ
jgi:hypothetical protein